MKMYLNLNEYFPAYLLDSSNGIPRHLHEYRLLYYYNVVSLGLPKWGELFRIWQSVSPRVFFL